MDHIALLQKQLRQIRPVLSGHPGDESHFIGHAISVRRGSAHSEYRFGCRTQIALRRPDKVPGLDSADFAEALHPAHREARVSQQSGLIRKTEDVAVMA